MYKLKIDPQIIEKYPQYEAHVLYVDGLNNKSSDDSTTALLKEAEQHARSGFVSQKPSTHPHIKGWREVYKIFGAKASKHLCSVEALLNRVLKDQDLPLINQTVDLYNAVSIKYVVPIGGEDWDCLQSDLTLKFATGEEPFIIQQKGQNITEYPRPGEVVWVDNAGVTCRRWNWRQCDRTALRVNTNKAYFVLDYLPCYKEGAVQKAATELADYLKLFSPNCTIKSEVLSQESLN